MFHAVIKSREDEDICILVQLDNHPWNYICDCGDASELTVKECQNTRALFISHTHFDHFSNFDGIIRHQLGIEREVVICGPRYIARQVQSRLQSYTWNLVAPNAIAYQVREIVDEQTVKVFTLRPPLWELEQTTEFFGNTVLKNKQFQVDFTILDHKTPSIAYRFQEADTVKIDLATSDFRAGKWVGILKEAFETGNAEQEIEVEGQLFRAKELAHLLFIKKGDTLGIIMDHAANTENHARIKALFTGCRQVLIESFFREEDRDLADLHYHSYAEASGRIMRLCEVKEAIPVHFSRKYEKSDLEILKAEFEKAYLA